MLLPLAAMGQYSISGRVIDYDTQKPIAAASIFLSNASAGTVSGNDGTFKVAGVRGGQYVLVISVIGYAPYQQTIMVNNNLTLPDVKIAIQAISLNEVRIGIDKHWAEHYAIFKEEFLGRSDNAKDCRILNPHAIDFTYNKEKGELTAIASGFLNIENKALGYKIKYQLSAFSKSNLLGTVYFEGLNAGKRTGRKLISVPACIFCGRPLPTKWPNRVLWWSASSASLTLLIPAASTTNILKPW